MKVAILSSFYPLRGGISQFNASLLAGLGKLHDVRAFSFKRQYPEILFPGKTQYVTPDDEAVPVEAEALLDTVNPFSWGKTARAIRAWEPDLLVMKYWMSWFAPSLGWVARHAGPRCKVVPVLDNVIPHEPHWFDKPLTKWFLSACDGFVTMSQSVTDDLLTLKPGARYVLLPHPLYSHFGEKLPREAAAEALGIDPSLKTLLFFGLIRDYKGLDILLEAFRDLPEDYQLVIAGEPYGSFDKYQARRDRPPLPERHPERHFLDLLPFRGADDRHRRGRPEGHHRRPWHGNCRPCAGPRGHPRRNPPLFFRPFRPDGLRPGDPPREGASRLGPLLRGPHRLRGPTLKATAP